MFSFLTIVALSLISNEFAYSPVANTKDITIKVYNAPKLGDILIDDNGMTLYIFVPDDKGSSTCYDACAALWPPFILSPDQTLPLSNSHLGVTRRKDNSQQLTYDGWPLYYYSQDKKPGDVKGQGMKDRWYVVNPKSGPNKKPLSGPKPKLTTTQ